MQIFKDFTYGANANYMNTIFLNTVIVEPRGPQKELSWEHRTENCTSMHLLVQMYLPLQLPHLPFLSISVREPLLLGLMVKGNHRRLILKLESLVQLKM